jgi:hypothetical protein
MQLSLDTPFQIQLSFSGLLENLERVAAGPSCDESVRAKDLLTEAAGHPELRNGITSLEQAEQNAVLIRRLLADYFPAALTLNEIKAICIPYRNVIFNHTERFRNLLSAAGEDFTINIKDLDEHQFYVASCCLILNEFYGTSLDLGRPLFYEIPTADGIIKYYRILYNADFLEIVPTDKFVPLSKEEIEELLDNYDNLALWKQKFPKESWVLKGFAIMTLFDATVENAVSILKEKLLGISAAGFRESIESIFRSIYRIPDIQIGFTAFNQEEDKLGPDPFGQQLSSFMLPGQQEENAGTVLCRTSYRNLVENKEYFAISDTAAFLAASPQSYLAAHFLARRIRSFILIPIEKNQRLFGFLEAVSFTPKALNSINANKLQVVMPFITDTTERLAAELENQVQAIIQEKYTTIHGSVNWKFRTEAQQYINAHQLGEEYELGEVVFPAVHPLYGQVDIKGSSEARNTSVQKDLQQQLEVLVQLLQEVNGHTTVEPFREEEQHLKEYLADLSLALKADTEQYITSYLGSKVHPCLQQISDPELLPSITQYFRETDKEKGVFHTYRRKYETTITKINKKLAAIIDHRQAEAQALFPHYYERFKTDGVEHNLYLGASIAPGKAFNLQKLYNLRIWQLRVLCEMETAHHYLKPSLPYPLEVTTLILVYHTTIDIRFRMDEKRFDVDGSYNARFEIVKKRIDKACVKGTSERITQAGMITIVYSNEEEAQEYIGYLHTLQAGNFLEKEIEQLEVEDLQGISGLKVLRVKMKHPADVPIRILQG